MREIALFVEDDAHQQVIGALVRRIAAQCDVSVRLDWRSAVGGHGRVIAELGEYLRDLRRQGSPWPDLIVAATDANCKGLNERAREIGHHDTPTSMVLERWLLLDGAAFKRVFGIGCDAPDQKCDRGRYKQRLIEAIHAAGTTPLLGGIEYAEDIVMAMDIDRASRLDRSFKRFVEDLRDAFQGWQG